MKLLQIEISSERKEKPWNYPPKSAKSLIECSLLKLVYMQRAVSSLIARSLLEWQKQLQILIRTNVEIVMAYVGILFLYCRSDCYV